MVKAADKPIIIKRPKKTPDDYNDIKALRLIIENAIGCGDLEYAEMARARIDYLNHGMREEIQAEFNRIMKVHEDFLAQKNGRKTPAIRTWRKVASKGEKQTMIDWARSKKPAEGFTWLVNEGKIEDTAEFLITSFPNDFPSDVVQLAQNRIDKTKRIQSAAVTENQDRQT